MRGTEENTVDQVFVIGSTEGEIRRHEGHEGYDEHCALRFCISRAQPR